MTRLNSQSDNFQPDALQFFTPVSVGVLVQLFCAGLVIAVTAAMSLSASSRTITVASSNETGRIAAGENPAAQPASSTESNRSDTTNTPADSVVGNTPASNVAAEDRRAATDGSEQGRITGAESSDAPAAGERSTSTETSVAETADNATTGPAANGASPDMTPAADSALTNGVRALDDVRKRGRKLPLAGEGLSDEIELCKIFAQDPSAVTLELIGGEFTVPEEMTLTLKPFPVDAKSFLWKVSQESTAGLARDQEIGEFILKEQQLSFRWFRNMDKGKLPFCRLRISAETDSEVCDLWAVARSGAAKVRLTKSQQIMDEFIPRGIRLPPFEILELDLSLENWPEHELSSDHLTFNETVTVTFPDEESGRDLMTLRFTLDKKDGRYGLRGEYFFSVASLSSRRKTTEVRYDEKELTIDQLKKTFDSLESSVQKVERELGGIQKTLEILNERLRQAINGGNNTPPAVVDQLNAQIGEKEAEEDEQQEILDELIAAIEDAETAESLCEEITAKGQIHYRLFRPFAGDGGDVVIASTVTQAAAVEESR